MSVDFSFLLGLIFAWTREFNQQLCNIITDIIYTVSFLFNSEPEKHLIWSSSYTFRMQWWLFLLFVKQVLTSNLAKWQQEKEDLQGKLKLREHLSQTAGKSEATPAPSKNSDLEMKQLQCKLKVTEQII